MTATQIIFIVAGLLVIGSIFYFRKGFGKLFFVKFQKEIFAFFLAFGTTNMLLTTFHFHTFYEELPEDAKATIDHVLYIFITCVLWAFYSFLLTNVSKRLLDEIEEKYSKVGANYGIFYSVLFNLKTHNDEFRILDTLLTDYKRLGDKHLYLISLDSYLELTKKFFKDGYEAIGINYLLPPFWIAPNFKNSSLIAYIDFLKAHNKTLKFKRITVLKETNDKTGLSNDAVTQALEEIKSSLDGIMGAYLWILDLVQSLEIKEKDFTSEKKFTEQEIRDNLVINGISWVRGVRQFYNSESQILIKEKKMEVEQKIKWFNENLLEVANTKVNDIFKALHSGTAYCVSSDLFKQEIKSKYNWAEVVVFENTTFSRCIGIAVINNVDNAVLIEVISDTNQLDTIKNILLREDFLNPYE